MVQATQCEFALLGARVHQETQQVVAEHSQLTELGYQRRVKSLETPEERGLRGGRSPCWFAVPAFVQTITAPHPTPPCLRVRSLVD